MHNFRETMTLMTRAQHEMIKAAPAPGFEMAAMLMCSWCIAGACVCDDVRQSMLSDFDLQDCGDIPDLERLIASSPSFAIYAGNKRYARSKDGR